MKPLLNVILAQISGFIMTSAFIFLLFVKWVFAFFAAIQVIRLCAIPGFAQLQFEGERTGKKVLLNNVIFLVVLVVLFLMMDRLGVNLD